MPYRPAMSGEQAGNVRIPDAAAIEAAHAIYTRSCFPQTVLVASPTVAWRCLTERLSILLYNLVVRHSEAR